MQDTLSQSAETMSLAHWTRTLRPSPLSVCLALTARPDILSLALGLPAAELFPCQDFLASAHKVLVSDPRALQYGPPLHSLKKHVVSLMEGRGVSCTEEQVFLTTGAQQALSLLARMLLNQHDEVLTESLVYPGLQHVLEPYQPRLLTVPTDTKTGIDVDAVECLLAGGARPAFIYVIPNGHNPLGIEMSLTKRRHLVDLAGRYQVVIIEDDPYGHLCYEGSPSPPLRALDDQWVLYVGSFSKILAPALRVGWVVVPEWLAHKLAPVKEAGDLNTATFSQRAISAYLDTGALPSHIESLCREYKIRRDTMLDALDEYFPHEAEWVAPQSGFFIWLELLKNVDTGRLLQEAVESQRVAFLPGRAFSVGSDGLGSNCMRLSFSTCTPQDIEEGIRRIACALRSMRRIPATMNRSGLSPLPSMPSEGPDSADLSATLYGSADKL